MKRRVKLVSIAIAAMTAGGMLLAGGSGAGASTAPKLTLATQPASAGNAVGVMGTHFGANEFVSLTLSGIPDGGGLTDDSGSFTGSTAIPLFFPPGVYELDAQGGTSGLRASIQVRVVAGCNPNGAPPSPSPLTATVHDKHTLQIEFSVANFHCSVATLQLTDGNWHASAKGGVAPFTNTAQFNPFPTDPDHLIPPGTSTVHWVVRAPGQSILTGTATVTNAPIATPGATGVQVSSGGSVIAGPVPSATGVADVSDSTSTLPAGFTTTQPITATDEYVLGIQDVADPGTLTISLGSAGTLAVSNLDVNLRCYTDCVGSTTFASLTLSLTGQAPLTLTEPPAPNTVYRFPGIGSLKLNTQTRSVGALHTTGVEFVAADGTSYVAGTVVGWFPATTGSQLVFISPPITGSVGESLGPLTIQVQDASGLPSGVFRPTVINLASSSATGVFSKSPGGAAITKITMVPGVNTVSVYYRDTTAGTPRLSARATGYVTGAQREAVLASAKIGS